MPIDPSTVGSTGDIFEASWDSKDCLLYALGVGAGVADPTGFELEFTTENSTGIEQRVLPTFPVVVVLGAQITALAQIGTFDHTMLVHGEQGVELHKPLPVSGQVRAQATVTGIYDKGSGAVVSTRTTSTDVADGKEIFTLTSSVFIRGEGGWGGDRGRSAVATAPERAPDHTVAYPTRTDQALLYRLSGDRNPLHSDPKLAAMAGFDRPILHGLCTFGFTGRALLHTLCGSDPDRFQAVSGRFSKPVFPGEQLDVEIWDMGDGEAFFRTSTGSGVVLDGGQCRYSP
jgi:acyl dehydratase